MQIFSLGSLNLHFSVLNCLQINMFVSQCTRYLCQLVSFWDVYAFMILLIMSCSYCICCLLYVTL